MEIFLEFLRITVPSVLVFLTAWFIMRTFMKKEKEAINGLIIRHHENKRLELLKESRKTLLPIRLQAYERLTLYCSRLEMGSLINRTRATETMPAAVYRSHLVKNVEEEFNHNITQQVYMTDDLWKIIQMAKQEVVAILNKVFQNLENDDATAKDFLERIVEHLSDNPQVGYLQALVAIKKEAGVLFE